VDMLLSRLANAKLVVNESWGTDSRDFLLELGTITSTFRLLAASTMLFRVISWI
jgi:hypothetical protein